MATRPRRRLWPWLVAAVLAVAVAATSFLPWEWSFIDDGGMLTFLHGYQHQHGWFLGALDMIYHDFQGDRAWGLFRPTFWVFTGTFYLLPVGAAHAVRIAMVLCAIIGPLVPIARRFHGGPRVGMLIWTTAVVVAGGELFVGIWYPSLQETSGLCFIGLGFLATRRHWPRVLAWLAAAWFKAPFAWLLLAYGLVLCRKRETRRLGIVTSLVSLGTLAAATLLARSGSYTSKLDFSPHNVRVNLDLSVGMFAAPLLVVVAGLVLLRPRIDISIAGDKDPTAVVLLLGGAGYLANLLAWNVGGYYAGPYVYLLTLGVVFAVTGIGTTNPRWMTAALVVPVLMAGFFLHDTAVEGYDRLATVTGLRDCVLRLPDGAVTGTNRHEAWVRLDYIVREHKPDWKGEVVLVLSGQVTGTDEDGAARGLDYFIYQPGYGFADPSLTSGPVVCRTPDANVYQVVPPTTA
ncbi:hypothetical protein GCM10023322_80040 [Rugosimonospora acidiphila]|uniref:DUF2029 domain-containing protein n=1 Tax=Rugosimonospora acidiphila TaxID=556531 RepID=A0ABP9ST77_9ACTN